MGELILDKNNIWVDGSNSVISYPIVGNDFYFELEDNSFWFKHRNNVLKSIIERFPFSKNYADIGGGNGFQAKFISENFAPQKVFLIEPGYHGCLNAQKRGLENVYNIPFQKFDFKGNNINAIGLYDVIEHIENDVEFLKELKSKLPKGSIIYITVPAHNYLWSDADDSGGHYRRYETKTLKQLSHNAGFELLYSSYFFSFTPPITFFLRSLPYKLRGARKDKNIFKSETLQHNPSAVILKMFNIFQRHELDKIKKSSMSSGASCIAVLIT